MRIPYNPKNNPRVIIIQKLYGKIFNQDEKILFPKHRFKKFIKDIVEGSIERKEVIDDEIKKYNEKLTKKKKTIKKLKRGNRISKKSFQKNLHKIYK